MTAPPAEVPEPQPVVGPDGHLDAAFVDALQRFWDAAARDLPWRRPRAGAWSVLVSEFMLQQTPVVRVLPVHEQWLARWPTPADLAAAAPAEVLRAWGRLGYPRRALRLHAAATAIVERHDGLVPDDVDALLALPGVGDYTARAVAAFAFRQRVPVVDTNVRRVLHRVLRGTDDAGPATRADRELLGALLPDDPGTAAATSATLMELGATVCRSRAPRCDACPVLTWCRWWHAGRPERTVHAPRQDWHGTDRQVRGRIMALLRAADHPLPVAALTDTSEDAAQRERCLAGLVADGLAVRSPDGAVRLP